MLPPTAEGGVAIPVQNPTVLLGDCLSPQKRQIKQLAIAYEGARVGEVGDRTFVGPVLPILGIEGVIDVGDALPMLLGPSLIEEVGTHRVTSPGETGVFRNHSGDLESGVPHVLVRRARWPKPAVVEADLTPVAD